MAKKKKSNSFWIGLIFGIIMGAVAVWYVYERVNEKDVKKETRRIEKKAKKELEKAEESVKELFNK